MLNPTDYAAYSRATGRPYPQNEEERAEMYSEVRNFRNNQLKSNNENNIGENIAIGALGLGGLALGTAAGRRALANRKAQKAASSAGGRRGGVGFADLARRREPTPSDQYRSSGFTGTERPTAAQRTDLRRDPQNLYRDLVDKYPDPGVGKDVEYRPPTSYEGQDAEIVNRQNMMIVDPDTGIMYPRGSSALSEKDRALMARRQRIQEINTYPDAPRKSNRPMGGPLAVVGDGSIDEVEASRQLARRQYAQAQIDERVDQLLKDLEPDVERESRAMMGQESARQTRNVNEVKKIKAEEILREIQQEDTLVDFQKNREPLIEEQSAAADSKKAARIARNQAKDRARVSDYMSDILQSVIDENYQYPEEVPSNLMGLARRAKQNKLTDSDFSSIQQWAQTEFKNDPTVLGEINESLSSLPKTSTLTETYEAFSEPAAQAQNINAINTAEDQSDGRFLRELQRNEDIDMTMVNEDVLDASSTQSAQDALFRENQLVQDARDYLIRQEIAQEPARMVLRHGKFVPLKQLQERAAQIAPPQVVLRQQDPNRFLRKAPSVSAEEINTFAGRFDVYGRPIPKAEQTLGLIGPQPRNVYSAETPGPAPANEAQIARRELARRAETLLGDIQTEEQAKGILFELAAQYDPQQALAAKRAELQAKGLKGQRLEKSLAATTGPDVRAALEDARLQPGLQTEGAPLKFSREVPNVGPEAVVTKTATGSAIRGASRLSDEFPAQSRERTLFGDYPDPLVTGQPVDLVPDRPGKENVLGQMISAPIPRIDKFAESQEGAGAGIGVYGRETDYVPGAVSKQTGEYSAASQRKPTDTTGFKTLSDKPTPYQGLSNEDLGQLTMLGSEAEAYNAERELAKRRSFDVSRDIRRIQSSGRPDAQQLVKDYIKNLGPEL